VGVVNAFEGDARQMSDAMLLARRAAIVGEVPVGAVVVMDGTISDRGYNQAIIGLYVKLRDKITGRGVQPGSTGFTG